MIRAKCHTSRDVPSHWDDYPHCGWPTEFACRPIAGDWVHPIHGDGEPLRIISISHHQDNFGPYIRLELNR